jgi:hypothetical protein
MSAWTEYVKENYHLVKHLPNKERLKALSQMYKGGSVPHGGELKGKKKGGKRGKKAVKGGDILDDVYNKVKKFSGGAKGIADTIDSGVDSAYKGARTLETGVKNVANRVSRGLSDLGNEFTGSLIEAII